MYFPYLLNYSSFTFKNNVRGSVTGFILELKKKYPTLDEKGVEGVSRCEKLIQNVILLTAEVVQFIQV